MKKIEEISFIWVLGIAILAGLLCHIAFGFAGVTVAFLVIFYWIGKKFGSIIFWIASIIILLAAFKAYMPQSHSKRPFALMGTDLFVAKQVDSVQVKADVIWEAEKNRQKDLLLVDYTKLLQAGKTEEARALLESIDRKFGKHESDTKTPDQPELVVLSLGERTFILPNVGDESPWIKYKKCSGGVHADINSPDKGYELIYSNMEVYQSTDSLPRMSNPVYKIRAKKPNQFVTVTVSKQQLKSKES